MWLLSEIPYNFVPQKCVEFLLWKQIQSISKSNKLDICNTIR